MKPATCWVSRHGLGYLLLAACYLGNSLPSLAADRKPVFTDPAIHLPPYSGSAVEIVKIKVEGLTPEEMQLPDPHLEDDSQLSLRGTVKFTVLTSEKVSESARLWYFKVAIDGLPPSQTQKRLARFQFSNMKEPVDYWVSNLATAASNWTVSPPPDPWVMTSWWPRTQCAAIGINPGDAPATSLRIQQSGVLEQTTKKLLGLDHLKLCRDAAGVECGNSGFDLPPHYGGPPLFLCVDKSFHGHGIYRGTVSLSALEKPETQSITLSISSSSFAAKVLGFLLILVGVVAAWVTKVLASNRLARDQELLPVTMLRGRLEALQSDLASLPTAFLDQMPQVTQDIAGMIEELEPAKLGGKNYIHPSTPNPLATPVDSSGFKALLADTDTRVNLLTVLIEEGAKRAVRMALRPAPPANADIIRALGLIDGLRGQSPLPSEAQARAIITQKILPDLAHTVVVAAGTPRPEPDLARPVSFDRLLFEITYLSLVVWGVAASLATLAGLVVLILNNAGFGVPVDYVYCVFWGFGIPTAVQQLTANSAFSALGVSVTKS